jgi:hypothetical protein
MKNELLLGAGLLALSAGLDEAEAAVPQSTAWESSLTVCTLASIGPTPTCSGSTSTTLASGTLTMNTPNGTLTLQGTSANGLALYNSSGSLQAQIDAAAGLILGGGTYGFTPAGVVTAATYKITGQTTSYLLSQNASGVVQQVTSVVNCSLSTNGQTLTCSTGIGTVTAGTGITVTNGSTSPTVTLNGATTLAIGGLQLVSATSNAAGTGTTLGAAAVRATTANGTLAAVSGAFTAGDLAVANDTAGTIKDGGQVPACAGTRYGFSAGYSWFAAEPFLGYGATNSTGSPTLNTVYYEPVVACLPPGYTHLVIQALGIRATNAGSAADTASMGLYNVQGAGATGTLLHYGPTTQISGSEVDTLTITGTGLQSKNLTAAVTLTATNQLVEFDIGFAITATGATRGTLTVAAANPSDLSSLIPSTGGSPLGVNPPTGLQDATAFSTTLPSTAGTISIVTAAAVPGMAFQAKVAP